MSEATPAFLRRNKGGPVPVPAPVPERQHDPRVKQFLDDFVNQQDSLDKMNSALCERNIQIDRLEDRAKLRDQDLVRITRQRDVAQRGFAEQKIHFAVVISHAMASKDHAMAAVEGAYRQAQAASTAAYEQAKAASITAFEESIAAVKAAYEPLVDAAQAAMRAINEEMRAAGMDPLEGDHPTSGAPVNVQAIAAQFGANSRNDDE